MGFKVVAIDQAGHGGTLGLPTGGATMAEALRRLLSELRPQNPVRIVPPGGAPKE